MQARPRFGKVVYMSDEAHFYLDGKVNKQNCRVWALENPHASLKHEVQSPHVTVAAIGAGFPRRFAPGWLGRAHSFND